MKNVKLVLATVILGLSFAACNSNSSSTTDTQQSSAKNVDNKEVVKMNNPFDGILKGYLHLKDALTADNGQGAANGGTEILDALKQINAGNLTPDQKKSFDALSADIQESSEHISKNANDIAHQREHFEVLSKDMYDLLKAEKTGVTLYQDSCPMYDNGKGTWLSETKEIKNPYLGKKMATCGAIKKTI